MGLLRVLIADDDPLDRARLKGMALWSRLGCTVIGEVDKGEDLLELAGKLYPDIAITGITMGNTGALEQIAGVRGCLPECEFLIISMNTEFSCVRAAFKQGVYDYLPKPVDERELEDSIKGLVEAIYSRRQTEGIITATGAKEENLSKLVREARRIVNSNFASNITLSEVARQLHVTTSYLSRLIKKETGETFVAYRTRIRVEHAKKLLARKDMCTNEVAEAIGCPNREYCSQVFRKLVGLTPKEYRAQALMGLLGA